MSSIATLDENVAFGRRLAAVRSTTGLSQGAFAATLGLSLRAFANYERGEREAPLALLRALFETYGIDPIWLLSGDSDTPKKAAARRMDFELVERITQKIDAQLASHRKKLKPEKRIQVLKALYSLALEHGKTTDSDVANVLSVAIRR